MGIMLGNLSLAQIQDRLQIKLSEEDIAAFPPRQEIAKNIEAGHWHCFDIPFIIVCNDTETAVKIRDILQKYAQNMKGQIQIGFGG